MLDKDLLDKELIENEIERIKIFFLKNEYNDKQKLWFITSKLSTAKENNDLILIEVCNELLKELT